MDLLEYFLSYFSDPEQWLTGQVGRQHGRPNQGTVDPAVDQRAQSCACLAAQWAGRPGGRPARELCSLENFGRPAGRPQFPNGQKIDRWRSTGRSTASRVRL